MPTYQYACTACGEQLEAVQSFTDAALTECPACGGALRKVFSAVGVVFKGSGFYKTDSRKAASGTSKAGGSEGSSGSEGSGSSAGSGGSDAGQAAPAAKSKDSTTPKAATTSTSTPPAAKTA